VQLIERVFIGVFAFIYSMLVERIVRAWWRRRG